jgi:hypothetical protein
MIESTVIILLLLFHNIEMGQELINLDNTMK